MTRARRRCGKWSVIASAATLAALAGCDEPTPLSRAIDQANIKLTALAPGGASPASPAYKAKVYHEVATALNAQSAHGTAGEKAAAQLLIAQAHLGLGDNPAAAAADIERQSLSVLTRLESALALWRNHNAVAAAAQKFDPSPEVAEIEAANKEKDASIVQETARRAQVDAKVAELRTEAASLLAQARDKHAREAELVRQIPNETAVRGEQLLREARQIAREADALEGRAAELDAQAAKIAPQAQEIQLAIDRLNNQKALLAKAREEVARRAAWHADQARQARAQAEQAARDADALVKELVETRERTDDAAGGKPCERAAELYDRAAAAAAAAAREANFRANAKLIEGAARQALGDLHGSNAQGLARAAETLASVAGAAPPLPNAARYADLLAQTQDQQKTALDAATEAYSAAVDAYKQAGGQGDARERLDRVQQKLARIVKVTTDGKVDLMAQTDGGGATGADGADEGTAPSGAEAAGDQSTVLGTLQLLIDRSRAQDIDGVFALFHAPDDAARNAIESMKQMVSPILLLDAACREKFGEGLPAGGAPAGAGMGVAGMTGDASAEDFEIDEQGDTARATLAGNPQAVELVKADDQWWIALPAADLAAAGPMITVLTQAIADAVDQVTGDIEAGTIDSSRAAMEALTQKLTAAMMGGARPPGGG